MLSFKQFVNTRYLPIFEHLTPEEEHFVAKKTLDTSVGREATRGVIPDGQSHVDIPLESPLHLRIKKHLTANPSQHGPWKLIDPHTVQSPHYTDPTGVTREGFKRPLSQILKSDPELLSDYSESRTKNTIKKVSNEPIDVIGDNEQKTRWTSDQISPETHKIVFSIHPKAVFGMSSEKKPWHSCAKVNIRGNPSFAAANLENHVNAGGGVGYLVSHDEPEPNNPITAVSRVAANIFVSNKGHVIYRAAPKRYGADDPYESFHNTFKNYLEEKFPIRDEEYKLHPGLYQGDYSEHEKIIRRPLTKEEREHHTNEFNEKISNKTVNREDIQHAIDHNYINNDHVKNIINNSSENYGSAQYYNNPTSVNNEGNVKTLLRGFRTGGAKLSKIHHNLLLDHPNKSISHDTKTSLSEAYADGKVRLHKDIVDKIVNSPNSDYATNLLATGHREGKITLTDEQLNSIIKNPENKNAHQSLAYGHINKTRQDGKAQLTDDQISAITKHAGSTAAHATLAESPRSLNPDHITNIINSPESVYAHALLARAHKENQLQLSPENINTIVNNKKASSAHKYLVPHLTSEQRTKILNTPNSEEAHENIADEHVLGKHTLNDSQIHTILNGTSDLAKAILKHGHDTGKIKLSDEQLSKFKDI